MSFLANLFKRSTTKDHLYKRLNRVLYRVPTTKTDITWADSLEGTIITGSTGSGKSSAVGRYIALAMLKNGFGACVLCAKSNEKDNWLAYAEQTNRTDDVIVFNTQSAYAFNFLAYEMKRKGPGAGDVNNIVNLIMGLNEQSRIHQSGESKDEKFWDNSLRRLVARTISLLKYAGEEISIKNMRRLVSDRLNEDDVMVFSNIQGAISNRDLDQRQRAQAQIDYETWVKSNYFLNLYERVNAPDSAGSNHEEIEWINDYWINELPKLSDKTTSIIVESYLGILEPFLNEGILKNKFSGNLSAELYPDNIFTKNKIVILDFPTKEYGISAIYAATMFKMSFQAAVERRQIEQEENPLPCSLFIDEYHSYASPSDSTFQATARSSMVASVYITQNINTLSFSMGSNMALERAKSLLGNLNIKYFCSNSNNDTNLWASKMIGNHMVDQATLNYQKDRSITKTVSKHKIEKVTTDEFTTLKTGGSTNKNKVEAIVFKAGKTWGYDKQNFAKVQFDQG